MTGKREVSKVRKVTVSTFVALAVFLTLAGEALAGGFAVTTFGSRRTGMLANMASTDELTAIFHNPSLLANQDGVRAHLSCSIAFSAAEFNIQALDAERFPEMACSPGDENCQWQVGEDGYYERSIKPLSTMGFLPYLGLSTDLGFISDSLEDVVVSVAVTAPNVYAGQLPADAPSSYFFIEGHFIVLSTIFGIGWKISDNFSVGGNISYNYMRLAYSRRFSLADIFRGRDGSGNAGLGDLVQGAIGDVRMDFLGVDHGVGWTLSALYSPTSWLSFGASFNANSEAILVGDVDIGPVSDEISQEGFEESVSMLNYRLPEKLKVHMSIPPYISAGFNVHFTDYFEFGFDVRLWLYNVFERRIIEPIYGTEEGTAPLTAENLSQDMNYDVSYDLSLGFLVRPFLRFGRLRSFEIMFGAGFDKSPVPDAYFTIENPSMDNWRVACGLRWWPDEGLRVSLTYMYFGYIERNVTTSKTNPPLNAIGNGSNQFPRLEIEYVF